MIGNMAKTPILVGTIYGLTLAAVYSVVVVLSTPYLSPATALTLSFDRNWALFLSLPSAFGVMMGVRAYLGTRRVCLSRGGDAFRASTSFLSSFFSLFSLSLVGCCGLLALWVSALLGTAAVVSIINLSLPLTLVSMAGMIASILFMIRSRRKTDGTVRET
jgi:hypothetical protein